MPRPRFSTLREQAQKHFEDNKASDFFASGMQYRMREEPGFDKYDRLLSDQTGATLLQYLQNEVKDSQDKTALLQTFQQDPHFAWLMFIEGYNHECRIMSRSTASQNPAAALFDLSDDGKTVIGIKDKTIKHVVIPDGIEEIGLNAFAHNKVIESVSFPGSLKYIDIGAFRECTSLKELKFSIGLQEIAPVAFVSCTSLKKVVLPSGMSDLIEGVFTGCSSLEEIYLPESIIGINLSALRDTSIKSIHIKSKTPEKINIDCNFCDDYYQCTLYVPKGTEASYRKIFPRFKYIVGE